MKLTLDAVIQLAKEKQLDQTDGQLAMEDAGARRSQGRRDLQHARRLVR